MDHFPRYGVTINMVQNTTSRNHKTPINTNHESFGGEMIHGDSINVRIQNSGLWIFCYQWTYIIPKIRRVGCLSSGTLPKRITRLKLWCVLEIHVSSASVFLAEKSVKLKQSPYHSTCNFSVEQIPSNEGNSWLLQKFIKLKKSVRKLDTLKTTKKR